LRNHPLWRRDHANHSRPRPSAERYPTPSCCHFHLFGTQPLDLARYIIVAGRWREDVETIRTSRGRRGAAGSVFGAEAKDVSADRKILSDRGEGKRSTPQRITAPFLDSPDGADQVADLASRISILECYAFDDFRQLFLSCRTRKDGSPLNLAIIRHAALKAYKGSLRRKRLRACIDPKVSNQTIRRLTI